MVSTVLPLASRRCQWKKSQCCMTRHSAQKICQSGSVQKVDPEFGSRSACIGRDDPLIPLFGCGSHLATLNCTTMLTPQIVFHSGWTSLHRSSCCRKTVTPDSTRRSLCSVLGAPVLFVLFPASLFYLFYFPIFGQICFIPVLFSNFLFYFGQNLEFTQYLLYFDVMWR